MACETHTQFASPVETVYNEASLPIQSNQAFNAKKQDEDREDREAGQ